MNVSESNSDSEGASSDSGTNSGGTSASPDHLGEDDDLPSGRDNSDADDENSIGTGSRCSDYSSGGENLDYGSQGEY